mmetsp:Transcript_101038/g.253365  ORF Transcript_101038/g.253365 Transcript_101038/m.253365 type:complete len:205 (-) Transcript_101038:612-1226(-)
MASSTSLAKASLASTGFLASPFFFPSPPFASAAAFCSAFRAARSAFSRSRKIFIRHFSNFVRSVFPRTFKSANNSWISSVDAGCSAKFSEPFALRLILWWVTRTSAGFWAARNSWAGMIFRSSPSSYPPRCFFFACFRYSFRETPWPSDFLLLSSGTRVSMKTYFGSKNFGSIFPALKPRHSTKISAETFREAVGFVASTLLNS